MACEGKKAEETAKHPTSQDGRGGKGGSGRAMRFPYTFTAKVVQFPWKYYYDNTWTFKYYFFGIIASVPVFTYFHIKANSPGNVALWKEIRRKEQEEYEKRFD